MGQVERLRTKVLLFIIVSGLMSFYVLSKLFTLFHFSKGPWFSALCIFSTVSYLFGAELLRIFNNDLVKGLSAFFSTWFGSLFVFFWTFGVYDLINFIVPISFAKVGFFIFGIDIIMILYSIYNATTFSVRTIRVESEKISRPFKIVQLSDLHIGAAHRDDFLEKTITRVNELNPDFVVITGDLIDGVHPYRGDEFTSLNKINSPVFFTLGNHEKFIDIEKVYSLLKNNKMTFLRNRSFVHEGIQIIGIDDEQTKSAFLNSFKSIIIDENKFSILLYHRPSVFNEVSKENIDLMLSGHTHGGQIFPLNVLMYLLDGPVKGIHRKNNTILYVSNGTGWWGPPMRLGSRNEITVIELIALPPKLTTQEQKDEIKKESLEYKLSDLLDEKNEENKTKNKSLKNKLPKTAEVISLRRGNSAIKASEKEDLLLHRLPKSFSNSSKKSEKVKSKNVTSKKINKSVKIKKQNTKNNRKEKKQKKKN